MRCSIRSAVRPPRRSSPPACASATRRRPTGPTSCSTWSPRSTARPRSTGAPRGCRPSSTASSSTACAPRPTRSWSAPARCGPSATGAWPSPTSCATRACRKGSHPTRSPWSSARGSTSPPTCRCSTKPRRRVVIATDSDATLPGLGRARSSTSAPATTCQLLMARLREQHGVRSIVCEGGPTLNSHLFAAGLVDELWLTLNPKVAGGAAALTIVAGTRAGRPGRAGADLGRRGRRRSVHALARVRRS